MLDRLFRPFRPGNRVQGKGVFWILASTSALLILMGWLLPWFVGPFSGGAGASPQDVVVSAPTGIGTVLVYVLGVAM
ncbi:MAG TPA: hypothetical protein VLO10_02920, partial [Candidatus Deferrimicrobium sp.]|nr:hypothetical protein [Candidatus Deferrimicrobium sp.]